jgi:hypothetical protein
MTPEQMRLAKLYADAERAARRKIAPVWDAIRHALAEDAVFNQRVASGDLVEMAEYHAANIAKLGGYDAQLRHVMAGALQLIEAMQRASVAAGENLFPGVTVTIPDDAPD